MDYYNALAEELAARYESVNFETVHDKVLEHLPKHRAQVLDIGAGSGRDAAALAARGHDVVAVEPADRLRERAQQLHTSRSIHWVADSLPALQKVYELGDHYDLILLSAVWMHLRPEVRDRAMRKLAGLLNPGGKIVITTRSVGFSGRRTLYRVDPDELTARAKDHGLEVVMTHASDDVLGREDVSWSSSRPTTAPRRCPSCATSSSTTPRPPPTSSGCCAPCFASPPAPAGWSRSETTAP